MSVYYIRANEMYPVYSLDKEQLWDDNAYIKLSNKGLAEYEELVKQYQKWQARFDKIFSGA